MGREWSFGTKCRILPTGSFVSQSLEELVGRLMLKESSTTSSGAVQVAMDRAGQGGPVARGMRGKGNALDGPSTEGVHAV